MRTKEGIEKVKFDYGNRYANEYGNITFYDEVIKHSKNIIDLIEVGDYVNGYKVIDKDYEGEMICLLMPFNEENQSIYNIVWNTKYFIKSIVTKEMYKSIEYRLED